jgi:hypothetical protein
MEAVSIGRNTSALNESVFERLYKARTFSSKMMFASNLECSKATSPTLRSKTSTLNESVFERLYKAHTVSSKLKCRALPRLNSTTKDRKNVSRQHPLHAVAPAFSPSQRPLRDDSLRLSVDPQTTPLSKPHPTSSKLEYRGRPSIVSPDAEKSSANSRENSSRRNANPQTTPLSKPPATSSEMKCVKCRGRPSIVSPDVKKSSAKSRRQSRAVAPALASSPTALKDDSLPLNVTLRTTLLYQKKYDTTAAFSDISSGLASLNLVQTFVEYEANQITNRAVAANVISALFHRDFPPCDRWEINPSTVEELGPDLFAVEKNATWEWGDNYSVTQAKATIRFGKDEIKVEEYSFFRCWLKIGGKSSKKMYYGFQKKEKDVSSDLPLLVSFKKHHSPRDLPSSPTGLGKIAAQSF